MRHTLDSDELSRAWLAVRLASGKDKDKPTLNRTVQIESYRDQGVRLTALDGYIVLSVWVPSIGAKTSKPPTKKPDEVVIAMDVDGRGNNLCGYLQSLVARQKEDSEPLLTTLDTKADAEDPEVLPGMSPSVVVLDHPGRERVQLGILDGEFPDWRKLVNAHKPTKTGQIDISTDLLGRIGKLGQRYPGNPVTLEMGGSGKPVKISIANTWVTGVVASRPVV